MPVWLLVRAHLIAAETLICLLVARRSLLVEMQYSVVAQDLLPGQLRWRLLMRLVKLAP